MHIKFILPALEEAHSPFWRPIKYSLFPPLGLATLAALCSPDDRLELCDEHVEPLALDDEPDLVVIQVYITNAYRAYEIADHYRKRRVFVAMGGLHPTALPEEAAAHADAIFCGPGENIFTQFLETFRRDRRAAEGRYTEMELRPHDHLTPRRDLIRRERYLVPNALVVSRGCPHRCDFCYADGFYRGRTRFLVHTIDRVMREIDGLPGRHLYFLDDHLFAHPAFARELFRELRGRGRLFQGATTVDAVLDHPDLLEAAREAGYRSAFIGFETLTSENLSTVNKRQNLGRSYAEVMRRLDALGILVNGSFIFGLDNDTPDTFRAVTEWALDSGVTTATFHLLTPYPGTRLYARMQAEGRITEGDWRRYDTRHLVFRHPRLSRKEAEAGYQWAYREFYRWGRIVRASRHHATAKMRWRHCMYGIAWKRLEPLWNFVIKNHYLTTARRGLEWLLQ